MKDEIEKWEKENGIKLFKKIGIKSGQTVLDFGARVGHYSIPAANVVGVKGLVYALDKDKRALEQLQRKAKRQRLENIKSIETDGNLEIDLEPGSVDVVLAYDVLHLLDNRKVVYKQVYQILRRGGLFSVYPKHNKLDSPGWGLENMTPEDIKTEIESHGFNFEKEYCGILSHDDTFNEGCILNFRKK